MLRIVGVLLCAILQNDEVEVIVITMKVIQSRKQKKTSDGSRHRKLARQILQYLRRGSSYVGVVVATSKSTCKKMNTGAIAKSRGDPGFS